MAHDVDVLHTCRRALNHAGVRVNVEEIEHCLSCHPAVQAAAVALVDSPTGNLSASNHYLLTCTS